MAQDIFGTALLDYLNGYYAEDIQTDSSISGADSMPLPYLFRDFKEMPTLEKKALELCKGNILDLGAGAGSHSLYLQKSHPVTALDISPGAIKVCKKRGIEQTICDDIWQIEDRKFDTILSLMNGTGICGKLNQLAPFLNHLKSLLTENGQILIDSSDLIYMYEDADGEHWIPSDIDYYGEVDFSMKYKGKTSETFPWLYVDYNTLQRCAHFNGLNCELIYEGEHFDYLAKLTILAA